MKQPLNLITVCTILFFFIVGCVGGRSDSRSSTVSNSAVSTNNSMSNSPATNSTAANSNTAATSTNSVKIEDVSAWEYSDKTDKMTSEQIKYAQVDSTNELDFDFPYQGGSKGSLMIRRKGGSDNVMLSISKGQFMHSYGDSNTVRLRFDEQKPFSVGFNEPSDSSSDLIFLESESKIISELKKSSRLRIEVEFYQEGTQVLEFNIKNLKWGGK